MTREQPRYPWPNGAPAAVALTFDVDAEAPHLWRARASRPRIAELEQRRFGPRQGVDRILEALAARNLRATFYVPGHVARRYPAVVAEIASAGHELGLHGDLHEPPTDLDRDGFRAATLRGIDALASITGRAPAGFRSPSWDMTVDAFATLADLGVEHDSSLMGHDHPYRVGALVEVPVHWAWDDAPYLRYVGQGDTRPPTPASALFDAWRHELAAAVRFGCLLTLTMHPWLSGRAGPSLALESLLGAVVESGVWVAAVGELAAWHAGLGPRHAAAADVVGLDDLDSHGTAAGRGGRP